MEEKEIEILGSIIVSLVWITPLVLFLPDVGYLAISIGALGFLITRKLMF